MNVAVEVVPGWEDEEEENRLSDGSSRASYIDEGTMRQRLASVIWSGEQTWIY